MLFNNTIHLFIGILLIAQLSTISWKVNCENASENHGNAIDEKSLSDDKIKKPYQFGYEIEDGQGNLQHRHEESDGDGAKVGSYGYVDANGIYRKVEYIADKNGFRVKMSSNEPGLQGYNSPTVSLVTKPYSPDVTTPVPINLLEVRNSFMKDEELTTKLPIQPPTVTQDHEKYEKARHHRKQSTPDHELERKKQLRKSFESELRPPAPPAPSRPPTPSISFSLSRARPREDSIRNAEAQYESAAADWSPRHQDPESDRNQDVKLNAKQNIVKSHSHSTPRRPPSSSSISSGERPIKLKIERQYPAYDLRIREKSAKNEVSDRNKQRFYHQPIDETRSKPRDYKSARDNPKGSEMKWNLHEKSPNKDNLANNRGRNSGELWNDKDKRVVNHNHKKMHFKHQPKAPIRQRSHFPDHHNPTQLPAPPIVPYVDYDLPEFPLPVNRFSQQSSSESTEHKPVHDTGSYSNEQETSQKQDRNYNKNYMHEKNMHPPPPPTSSSSTESGYNNYPTKPKYLPTQNALIQPHLAKTLPPSYSSQHARQSHQPSLVPNNQRAPARKRPAAYPDKPYTESYESSRSELSEQSSPPLPPHIITNMVPQVFYENSASDEGSFSEPNSQDAEMNHSGQQQQPNHYQNKHRDWYSVEGDQADLNEPISINKIASRESQENGPSMKRNVLMDDSYSSYHQRIPLEPRQDNADSVEKSRETLTSSSSSSSSSEAYAAFKTGLKGLFPLINRGEDDPYKASRPVQNAASQRVDEFLSTSPKRSSYSALSIDSLKSLPPPTLPKKLTPFYKD